jgi:hypothetical protein
MRRTPPTIVIFRVVTAAVTFLLLALLTFALVKVGTGASVTVNASQPSPATRQVPGSTEATTP